MFLKIPTFKTPSLHAQHQPYLEGGRLLFCCGVTFLGDSTSLVLSRLSRLALLMWVCRILVALSWNGLGRFVNIMDSSGAFRLNRSISTNWAALKLKHEENELLLATTNFYLKSWSSYYTLTLMTIESSLHIFLEIFAYFAQVHVIDDDDDDDVEAKPTFLTSTLLGSVVKLMMRDSTSLVSAELTKSVSFITNTRLCM